MISICFGPELWDHVTGRRERNAYDTGWKYRFDRGGCAKCPLQHAAVRREHPKIERKLSELVRRHGARRARYRGLARVLCGQLLAAMAANVKRIVYLLRARKLASEGV